ncbi:MAG: DUF2752 domain-containing protein [Myxococcales bacterium]|nr:DUF2752 domain-containing protein [Myxococcales bacterium]
MLGALAVGTFGSDALRARVVEDGPGCPFRTATSWKCAFCGMTHATVALGHGDVRAAFAEHPLAPAVLAAMIYLCGLIVLGRGDALVRGRRPQLILGAIAAIWIVNLVG